MNQTIKHLFDPEDKLDQRSVEFLTNALASSSQQGFDYLKFKSSLQQLEALNMDQTTAVKSAFATAGTVGLSKDRLIHSSEHYRKVLMQEKEQFEAAMRSQLEKRVSNKEDETEYLKEKIIEYKQKIKELQENIASYESKVNSADEAIEQEKEKIRSTQEKFVDAHGAFIKALDEDVRLFKEIL